MTLTFPALTCENCKQAFLFSADDREFFLLRGYPAPTQCRLCRRARKDEPGNDMSNVPRQVRHDTCSECSETSEIKFHLWGHPSAYCRDCFDKRTAVKSR